MKKPCGTRIGLVEVGGGGHQAGSLQKWVGELVDAALVAAAGEIRGEKGGDAGLGHFDADQPRAQGDDVGVIMLAGERGGKRLGNAGAAAGRIAVGGDRDADARAAHRDAAIGAAGGDRLGQLAP